MMSSDLFFFKPVHIVLLHIKWVPVLQQCHHSWAGLNGSLLSVATVAMETRGG